MNNIINDGIMILHCIRFAIYYVTVLLEGFGSKIKAYLR